MISHKSTQYSLCDFCTMYNTCTIDGGHFLTLRNIRGCFSCIVHDKTIEYNTGLHPHSAPESPPTHAIRLELPSPFGLDVVYHHFTGAFPNKPTHEKQISQTLEQGHMQGFYPLWSAAPSNLCSSHRESNSRNYILPLQYNGDLQFCLIQG